MYAKLGRNNESIAYDLFVKVCKSQLGMQFVREYKFHPKRRWRFDYALPAFKIALEVEGGVWTEGRHTRGRGFIGDMHKYNTATLMGWRVFRTTPTDLLKSSTLNLLSAAIDGSAFVENVQKSDISVSKQGKNEKKCTK